MRRTHLSGILILLTFFILNSLAYGELGNPNAPLPTGSSDTSAMKHEKQEMMEHGAGGYHGRMGHGMMGHEMMMEHPMGRCMSGGHRERMMGAAHQIGRYLAALNLDERQKMAIDAIKSRVMKDTIRRMADIQIAQIELRDMIKQDPMDMMAVEAKAKQIATMKSDFTISHLRALEEIKKTLTPEQRKKLMSMLMSGPLMDHMGMMHR